MHQIYDVMNLATNDKGKFKGESWEAVCDGKAYEFKLEVDSCKLINEW